MQSMCFFSKVQPWEFSTATCVTAVVTETLAIALTRPNAHLECSVRVINCSPRWLYERNNSIGKLCKTLQNFTKHYNSSEKFTNLHKVSYILIAF